ncbi:hypothetical protein D9M71_339180 [compost metagenome]
MLLAAGQAPRVGVFLARQANLGQQASAQFDGLLAGRLLDDHRALDHVIQGSAVREQVEVLEHEPGLLAQAANRTLLAAQRAVGIDADVTDLDLPGIGGFQQVEAAQEGGLARAAGADDGHHFAGLHGQVDTVEHGLALEPLGQAFDFNHAQCSWSCWLTRASMRFWKCARILQSIQ